MSPTPARVANGPFTPNTGEFKPSFLPVILGVEKVIYTAIAVAIYWFGSKNLYDSQLALVKAYHLDHLFYTVLLLTLLFQWTGAVCFSNRYAVGAPLPHHHVSLHVSSFPSFLLQGTSFLNF